MAEPKWTPGPWFACPSHDGIVWTDSRAISHMEFEGAAEPSDIAHTTRPWPPGVADANARLIAAAPELYAALEYIFEHIADKHRGPRDLYPAFGLDAGRAVEMGRAALAKARGEVTAPDTAGE